MDNTTTGARILDVLQQRPELKLKQESPGQWRLNSPLRPDSDSLSFTLTIDDSGEKGAWTDYAAREGAGENGSLYALAEKLGVDVAHKSVLDLPVMGSSKRKYDGLNDYANEHGVDGDVFRASGWADEIKYQGRPALPFQTKTGLRYRFIDGEKPSYKHAYGYKPTWYGLTKAQALMKHSDDTIVICNGEASTVVAQYYGIAACCITAGEKSRLNEEQLNELKAVAPKNILVAFDCDAKGRAAAPKLASFLNSAGLNARAIGFGKDNGYDLADFCKENTTASALEVLELDDLSEHANGNILLDETPDDEGTARCTLFLYKGKFLYTNEMGWLYYDGKKWTTDTAQAKVNIAVLDTLKKRRIAAVKNGYELLVKKTQGTAANMNNTSAIIKSLVAVSINYFEPDKKLLNCNNGVVNLKTKEIKRHSHKQRFLYCLNTDYKSDVDYTEWARWVYESVAPKSLHDSMDDEKTHHYTELTQWIQRAVGYTLTGYTKENCLFYIQGKTRSGKGVFLQTISKLLGKPLAQTVDFNLFVSKNGADAQNFGLAPLKPSRMIVASESDNRVKLDEKLIKAMTGDDPIRCAFKRKDAFEYVPEFKMWMASNFYVTGNANDDAFWGRIRAITFPNTYLGSEDFNLKEKLQKKESLEAILAWAVDGAVEWIESSKTNGLGIPPIMKSTISKHRNESDSVWNFIEEKCILQEGAIESGVMLVSAYQNWCNENGYSPLHRRRFSSSLRERFKVEYKNVRINGKQQKSWVGISVKNT